MSDDIFRRHKLADVIPHPQTTGDSSSSNAPPDQATIAEQQRETQENSRAHNAQGGLRDRLVDIGKAHHMAGRGNGRVSDS